MYNYAGVTINAEKNWWGDASGPGGQGPGTGNNVSANVSYDPWYINAERTTLSNELSDVYVNSAMGNDSNLGDTADTAKVTIQAGIDVVDENGTVNVADGTYNELININKSNLTVQSTAGSATTIIDATGLISTLEDVVTITADEVTLDGFTVQNAHAVTAPTYHEGPAGICIRGTDTDPITGCSISNVVIKNLSGFLQVYGLYTYYADGNTFSNLDISDLTEKEEGPYSEHGSFGIWLSYSDNNVFSDITIDNLNAFHENAIGIMLYSSCDGNTFTNTAISGLHTHLYPRGISIWARDPNPPSSHNTFNHTTISNVNGTEAVYGISDRSLSGQENVGNEFIDTHISGLTSTGGSGFTYGIYNQYTNSTECIDTYISDLNAGSVIGFNNEHAANLLIRGGEIQDISATGFNAAINILGSTSTATITGMTITNAGHGIRIASDAVASQVSAHFNNITANTDYGVKNDAASTVNATRNYWGAADGPGGHGPGSGDKVSTNVTYSPWYTDEKMTTTKEEASDYRIGGVTVIIMPKINSTSAGNSTNFTVRVINTQNYNEVVNLTLTLIEGTATYNLTWFNWTTQSLAIEADSSEDRVLRADIPTGTGSGYKVFGIIADTQHAGTSKDYGAINVTKGGED